MFYFFEIASWKTQKLKEKRKLEVKAIKEL